MSFLTDDLRNRILDLLPRYPSKQAVTLPALHIVQDEMRYVPAEAVREIADMLDLSPAEVHDTMSFYGIFRETEKEKLGKTRLWVCRGLACAQALERGQVAFLGRALVPLESDALERVFCDRLPEQVLAGIVVGDQRMLKAGALRDAAYARRLETLLRKLGERRLQDGRASRMRTLLLGALPGGSRSDAFCD